MELLLNPPDAQTPRLLTTVNLNAPRDRLERDILAWASQLNEGPVFSLQALESLRGKMIKRNDDRARCLAMDVYMAIGALQARERSPTESWESFLYAWQEHRLNSRLGRATEMEQLRNLQDRFGGILLLGRGAPVVLLIPCSDGCWVQMGWHLLMHLASSPLTSGRPPHVMRRHAEN